MQRAMRTATDNFDKYNLTEYNNNRSKALELSVINYWVLNSILQHTNLDDSKFVVRLALQPSNLSTKSQFDTVKKRRRGLNRYYVLHDHRKSEAR